MFVDDLWALLHYAPETGIFIWRVKRGKMLPGMRAGCQRKDGYRLVGIEGQNYLESRLAWFYMTGRWPVNEIDHRDLNPSNNRWANLREATKAQNACNTRRRVDNTSGFKGVRRAHQKIGWYSGLYADGRYRHIGTFPTAEDAAEAYQVAAEVTRGEFTRHE